MKILTFGDTQESYLKRLLKHLTPFREIEVSTLLSTPFQIVYEDHDKWWYTTIVYKAVTKSLHVLLTNWGCRFSCRLHFKQLMKILTIDDIQQSYRKLWLKHFMPSWQIELSLFLASPFQKTDEDPDNWWYATIVYKAVTGTLHALLTHWGVGFPVISISNFRWRSWQMMIFNNRI